MIRSLLIDIKKIIFSYSMGTPAYGYATCLLRKDFMDSMIPSELHTDPRIMTLNGHENDTNRLYFWQLYSLLGEERITQLITQFYELIFDDKETFFSDTFKKLGTLDHHITGQTNFWLDAMGGGKRYPGGEHKLKRHHYLAKQIMNEKGARRWLLHMKSTLNSVISSNFTTDDRVKPCIVDFINFFMKKYGDEFNFHSRL